MIHRSTGAVEALNDQQDDWRSLLRDSRITTQQLLNRLNLSEHPLAAASAESLFELRVPPPYLDKIEAGNPTDPLLLQVLPQAQEHLKVEGFDADPLQESAFSPARGIIHKYHNRVLLIASQACAIHCRYCFRRHFPYAEHRQSRSQWHEALDYIRANPAIDEVILSGGDPMILDNDYLGDLLQALQDIPHLRHLRIHSRLLCSLPQRIDDGLLALIERLNLPLVIVLHSNHPHEMDALLHDKLQALRQRGVTLLNQSVLLRGVNDNADTLATLSHRLFAAGVLPYYLFLLDRVEGAGHFEVPEPEARALYRALMARVSGYLLPRLMVEIPGQTSKTPVSL